MHRTYKSKKDTIGALEPPESLFSVDDKSSAFDAYFIQNIKQTKRELSCAGQTHKLNADSKVRKRKYVRRIVKEAEPVVKESSPKKCTFLTPDKSFRVNKAPDLFDQIAQSSPPCTAETVTKEDDFFSKLISDKPKPVYRRKTYQRKIIRKINCSSDSESDFSDSEKENSATNIQPTEIGQDVSDIRKYEFVIEKEQKKSAVPTDDSIIDVINNFSLLKQLRVSADCKTDNRHRLTENINASVTNSPQCSTPFMEKYRGKSIYYKFSPIQMNLNSSDSDNEIKTISVVARQTDAAVDNNRINNVPENVLEDVIEVPCDVEEKSLMTDNNSKTENLRENVCDKKQSDSSNSIQDSTELNPFLGFTNNSQVLASFNNLDKFLKNTSRNTEYQSPVFQMSKKLSGHSSRVSVRNKTAKDNTVRKSLKLISNSKGQRDSTGPRTSNIKTRDSYIGPRASNIGSRASNIGTRESNTSDVNVMEISEKLEPFLGFTNSSILDVSNREDELNRNDTVVEFKKTAHSISVDSSSQEDYDSASDNETESNYDTCSSTQSDEESMQVTKKIPVIVMKKMNDSLFDKYFREMVKTESDNSDLENDVSINSNADESQNNLTNINTDDKCDSDDSEPNTASSNEDNYVQKHVSFVTTTRRRNYADDSMLMLLNESQASSEDCDTTIINKNNLETTDKVEQPFEHKIDESKLATNEYRLDDTGLASKEVVDMKPQIVLQPGKKWERSLSIYRRMTMMDASILDEDELKNKGRKYRQSVIHTMEVQERGPLHNESICSRRNTIVQKQHRSTIRIVKDPSCSRISINSTATYDDLDGYLPEDCDDTLVELSKLSIADEHEITVLGKVDDPPERETSARDYVLRRCQQTEELLFDECYPESLLKNCHKIGEGVYGEVFLYRSRDGSVRVMKVVPVAGLTPVNGEAQKDFQEVISEIVIAMELSALRAPIPDVERQLEDCADAGLLDLHDIGNATDVFNEVLAVRLVTGPYPSRLLDLWDLYDETKGSENDNPAALPADQRFIVLELANAGHDLESYQFNSAEQAYAVFLQVAYGLAVAEEAYEFEHRDLHWGNVLIAPTDQKYATFVLSGRVCRVPRCGVRASVIDYSLSRLALPAPPQRHRGASAAQLYSDLSKDEGLFAATGDYQFEVYRLMRDKLNNDWKNYEPSTNVLWLHYTVDKMIAALRYKRTNTKIHKHYIAKLKGIKNRVLDYASAKHFVLTDEF